MLPSSARDEERARTVATIYTYEAYPQPAMRSSGSQCPASIDELHELVLDAYDRVDPWAVPYELLCGRRRRREVVGVVSART